MQRNPWEEFIELHPVGSTIEGEVRNITEFGLFIGISADIDGMVHMSDISWDEPGELAMAKFEKGTAVRAKVLTSMSRRSASASASSSSPRTRPPTRSAA